MPTSLSHRRDKKEGGHNSTALIANALGTLWKNVINSTGI